MGADAGFQPLENVRAQARGQPRPEPGEIVAVRVFVEKIELVTDQGGKRSLNRYSLPREGIERPLGGKAAMGEKSMPVFISPNL